VNCELTAIGGYRTVNLTLEGNSSGEIARMYQLRLQKGICVPAECSPTKVLEFANSFLVAADLRPLGISCRTDEREPFEVIDIVAM
jgi:hypothetical protein